MDDRPIHGGGKFALQVYLVGREALRHRGEPEQRICFHRLAIVDIGHAEALEIGDLTVARDHGHGTCDLILFHGVLDLLPNPRPRNSSERDDDLAHEAAVSHEVVGFLRLLETEHAVDDRADPMFFHEGVHRLEVGA